MQPIDFQKRKARLRADLAGVEAEIPQLSLRAEQGAQGAQAELDQVESIAATLRKRIQQAEVADRKQAADSTKEARAIRARRLRETRQTIPEDRKRLVQLSAEIVGLLAHDIRIRVAEAEVICSRLRPACAELVSTHPKWLTLWGAVEQPSSLRAGFIPAAIAEALLRSGLTTTFDLPGVTPSRVYGFEHAEHADDLVAEMKQRVERNVARLDQLLDDAVENAELAVEEAQA